MSKTVFKVGDKVFSIHYGWGKIIGIDADSPYPVKVDFYKVSRLQTFLLNGSEIAKEVPTLSFTEYTLSGFSQERPMELPELCEEIMVSNSGKTWKMVKFIRHLPEMEYGFVGVDEDDDIEEYKYFKRLR